MATKPKKTPSYDLKAADRRRSMFIRIGLTALVVVIAAALFGYIVLGSPEKSKSGDVKAIRVASSNVVKNGDQPKVVLSMYEDFLCPHCGAFETQFGPTIKKMIDSGAVAADYYMVALPMLDTAATQNYSSRAGGAAYCVADADTTPTKDAFYYFHSQLYAQQPSETGGPYPTNDQLIEAARQAGVAGDVPGCINSGRNVPMVKGLVQATGIQATPTIKINGEDFAITQQTTPQTLVDKVKSIVGDVPGLETAPPNAPLPTGADGGQTPAGQ